MLSLAGDAARSPVGSSSGVAVLVVLLTGPFGSLAGASEPSAVQLRGTVKSGTGDPIGGATVTVNHQQFTTNADGGWDGRLPFEAVYHYWATAEGYGISPPAGTVTATGTGLDVLPLSMDSVVPSLFDVDRSKYEQLHNTVPPTITQFASDQGIQKRQVLPAETQAIVVQGTVGSREGHPLLRPDAYLAHPDDSVEQLSADIEGDRFSATFPLTSGLGKYQIELLDTSGSAVINAPLFVGVAYTSASPVVSDPDLSPANSELQALNGWRRSARARGSTRLMLTLAWRGWPRTTWRTWWRTTGGAAAGRTDRATWTILTAAGVPLVWRPVRVYAGPSRRPSAKASLPAVQQRAIDDLFESPSPPVRPVRRLRACRRRGRQRGGQPIVRHRVRGRVAGSMM